MGRSERLFNVIYYYKVPKQCPLVLLKGRELEGKRQVISVKRVSYREGGTVIFSSINTKIIWKVLEQKFLQIVFKNQGNTSKKT